MSRSEGIRQMIASAQLDRIWPYIFSIVVGALSWSLVWGSQILLLPDGISDQMVVLTGLLMIVDVFLGLIALLLLPFRRRAPLTIATVVTISLVISASATGAAMVAVVHMAARVTALETSIAHYPGAVIVVSHDRWLRTHWTGRTQHLSTPAASKG